MPRPEVISAERDPVGRLQVECLWEINDAEVAQFERTGLRRVRDAEGNEVPDRHILTQVHSILSPARAATRGQRIITRESDGWLLHASGIFLPPDIEPDDPRLWQYRSAGHDLDVWQRTRGGPVEAFGFVPTKFLRAEEDGEPEFLDPQWQRETFTRNPDDEIARIVEWKGRLLDRQLVEGKPIEERQRTTLNLQVGAGADDSRRNSGGWSNSSVANNVGESAVDVVHSQQRFTSVAIPAGSTINSSSLQYYTYDKSGTTAFTKLHFEDVDDAGAVSNESDFTTRLGGVTTAQIDLDIALGSEFPLEQFTATPDVSTSLQEVVDRPGWAEDNDLNHFWDDDGSAASNFIQTRSYDFGSAEAPKLDIDFTEGAAGETHELTGDARSDTRFFGGVDLTRDVSGDARSDTRAEASARLTHGLATSARSTTRAEASATLTHGLSGDARSDTRLTGSLTVGGIVSLAGSARSDTRASAAVALTRALSVAARSETRTEAALAVLRALSADARSDTRLTGALARSLTLAGDLRSDTRLEVALAALRALSGDARSTTRLVGNFDVGGVLSIKGSARSTSRAEAGLTLALTLAGDARSTTRAEANLTTGGVVSMSGAARSTTRAEAGLGVVRTVSTAARSSTTVTAAVAVTRGVSGAARSDTRAEALLTVTVLLVTDARSTTRAVAVISLTRSLSGSARSTTRFENDSVPDIIITVTAVLDATLVLAPSLDADLVLTADLEGT